MNLYRVFALSILLIGLLACSQSTSHASEIGELIEVLHSSGDDYSYSQDGQEQFYAPYPFNQGSIQSKGGESLEVVILSKKIEKGTVIGTEIFAKMTIVDLEGSETAILIARPTNEEYELTPIQNFYDFSVEQFYFKQMVQYWYSNRYGLNGTIVKGWEPFSIATFKE